MRVLLAAGGTQLLEAQGKAVAIPRLGGCGSRGVPRRRTVAVTLRGRRRGSEADGRAVGANDGEEVVVEVAEGRVARPEPEPAVHHDGEDVEQVQRLAARAVVGHLTEQLHDGVARLGVEPRHRLVKAHHIGLEGQQHRQAEPSPLPAREYTYAAVAGSEQAHLAQGCDGGLACSLDRVVPGRQQHGVHLLLHHRHIEMQVVVRLRLVLDAQLTRLHGCVGTLLAHPDAPLHQRLIAHPSEHLEEGGLARAR
eukprot:scaffold3324_cov371-Prasinococcus_capsulatus_cf.AAC.11